MSLEQEAVRITKELGDVVFIGALAVNQYARSRRTKDIDLVIAGPLNEKRLSELGYRPRQGARTSWYTPRRIQADFFTRDVSRIPVGWILKNAAQVKIGSNEIGVTCLEALILTKHRAERTQDVADLQQLMKSRGGRIRWDIVAQIATDLELTELRKVAAAFG